MKCIYPFIRAASLIIILYHDSFCFGYNLCHRGTSFRIRCNQKYPHDILRLMAVEPSSSQQEEANAPNEDVNTKLVEPPAKTRTSKRKRIANFARRYLLPSFITKRTRNKKQQSATYQIHDEVLSSNETLLISENESIEEGDISSEDEVNVSRQCKAADDVNLSGTWRPIVTSEFKKQYDSYLINCGESLLFRKVVVNGIGLQKEIINHIIETGDLEIIATNPAGNWNRTLVSSDADNPLNATIVDPDGDTVQVEAWWTDNGTRHKSLLQGKPRVEGGVFETVRYLESDNVLVCDSSFHPCASSSKKFKYGNVVWKFQREKDKS